MKKIFILTVVCCVFFAMSVTSLHSQVRKINPKIKTNLKVRKFQLKLSTDLRVDVIHASRCKCDLSDVGAFYMSNIMVDVSNHKLRGVGTTTESVLTVKYFDMNRGRMVTITKNLPRMNPYPKNPWTLQRFMVVNHPVLVKTSVGITAEIKPKTSNVSDPVPANNKKTIKRCSPMIY